MATRHIGLIVTGCLIGGLVAALALCVYLGRTGDDLPLGVVEIAGAHWHPLSLLFFINGSMMISKTLRIPKF